MEDDPLYQSPAWTQLSAADPVLRRAAMHAVLAALRAQPLASPDVARDVLLLALDDADEAVRSAAVHAVATLGPIELLVPAMQSPDARTRRTAFQLLERHVVERSPALRIAVYAAANDPDRFVAQRALELGGGDDAAGRRQVIAMLDHPSQRVRADAVRACAARRLDVGDADLIRALRRALRHGATRRRALVVLRNVEPRAVSRGLLDDIVPGLASRDRRDRFDTARTLAALGRHARASLPAVEAALVAADPHNYDRDALVYAALRLGSATPRIVDELIRVVQPTRQWIHWSRLDHAIPLLEWLGPLAVAAVPALEARAVAADPYRSPDLQHDIIAALVAIAPAAPNTVALRDRFATAAAGFPERVAAFASCGDPVARARRVIEWLLLAPPYRGLDVANLALDAIEEAPASREILEDLVTRPGDSDVLAEVARRLQYAARCAGKFP